MEKDTCKICYSSEGITWGDANKFINDLNGDGHLRTKAHDMNIRTYLSDDLRFRKIFIAKEPDDFYIVFTETGYAISKKFKSFDSAFKNAKKVFGKLKPDYA